VFDAGADTPVFAVVVVADDPGCRLLGVDW